MSMQERGYICENGRTHGILRLLALGTKQQLEYSRRLLLGSKPSDVDHLFVFLESSDWHRHVIIRRHNLSKLVTFTGRKLNLELQTSWKSSLNLLCNNSAYFSNNVSRKLSSAETE